MKSKTPITINIFLSLFWIDKFVVQRIRSILLDDFVRRKATRGQKSVDFWREKHVFLGECFLFGHNYFQGSLQIEFDFFILATWGRKSISINRKCSNAKSKFLRRLTKAELIVLPFSHRRKSKLQTRLPGHEFFCSARKKNPKKIVEGGNFWNLLLRRIECFHRSASNRIHKVHSCDNLDENRRDKKVDIDSSDIELFRSVFFRRIDKSDKNLGRVRIRQYSFLWATDKPTADSHIDKSDNLHEKNKILFFSNRKKTFPFVSFLPLKSFR